MRFAISTPHGSKSFPLSAIALLSLLVCFPLSPLGEGVGERGVRAANPPPRPSPKGGGRTQIRAQTTQCLLKLAELPASEELFGFRLGMTAAQVKAHIPQIVFGKTNDLGVSKTTINPDFDPRIDKNAFAGVRTISLDFLDNRVSSLWFGYESSFKWHTVPDFVAGISQSLRLPDAWEPWKSRGSRIRCADFQITLSLIAGGVSFHLIDETAEQTIAARRETKDQETIAAEAEGESEIIADVQSRVYYSGTCRPTTEVKETNRVLFKTKEEAEKAGYKAAKNCQ
jgi:hypothetical protein